MKNLPVTSRHDGPNRSAGADGATPRAPFTAIGGPARDVSKAQPGPSSGPSSRLRLHIAALVSYAVFFAALLLPRLLPAEPGRILANSPADGSIFLWSIGWWAHALVHGHVVPYTHAVFAPGGVNLVWTTSIPVPSLLAFPVTRAFGAFAAFNLLSIAAPITAGWATYLLVYRLTGKWPASLIAGFVFALAPLEITEVAIGHLNLSLVALVPVAAYLVTRRFEGSIRPWTFVLSLGVVLALQASVSTEILVTMTLFGGVALALAWAMCRVDRSAIGRCAALVGLSYGVAALLASPLIVAAIALPHPPSRVASGRGASSVAGWAPTGPPTPERSGHTASLVPHAVLLVILLLPLAAALANLLWTRRHDPIVRALAATAVVAVVCSVGVTGIGGLRIPMPWALLGRLPFLRYASPQRLSLFAWLIAAVGVGVWLEGRKVRARRWLAGLAVVACLGLQVFLLESWTSVVSTPSFVVAHRYVAPGANVAVVAGPSGPGSHQLNDLAFPTVWQVQSGFAFRLADAYVGSLPPSLPRVAQDFVLERPLPPGGESDLLAWLHTAGVRWVLVVHPPAAEIRQVAALLGTAPIRVDGLALFPVPPARSMSG